MKKLRVFTGFKLLMIFAFMWLVIGELIIFHQKRIYHVDFFEGKNLFIKPKSGDDEQATLLVLKNPNLQLEPNFQLACLISAYYSLASYSKPYTPNYFINSLKAQSNATEYFAKRAPPFFLPAIN